MSANKNDYVKIRSFPGDIPRRMKIHLYEGDVEKAELDRKGMVQDDTNFEKLCKNYKKHHIQQAKKRQRRADREVLRRCDDDV